MSVCCRELERDAAAELQRAGTLGRGIAGAEAGDVAKGAATHRCIGVRVEQRMVEQVEGFHANLEIDLLVDVEVPEDAGVDQRNTGATELIAVGVGEEGRRVADLTCGAGHVTCCAWSRELRLDGVGEGGGVEPGAATRATSRTAMSA